MRIRFFKKVSIKILKKIKEISIQILDKYPFFHVQEEKGTSTNYVDN